MSETINSQPGRRETRILIAAFLMPWMTITGAAVMAVLNDMSAALNVSQDTARLVGTMPNITMIFSSLIGGAVVARRLEYKTHLTISMLLMLISGVAPYFTDNITVVFVCRAIFGLGMGFSAPINSSLIFRTFTEDRLARAMGMNTIAMFTSGVAYTLLGSAVCVFNWRNAFLLHVVTLIPFIAVMRILPHVPRVSSTTEDGSAVVRKKLWQRLPPKSFGYIGIGFLFMLFTFPLQVNVSFMMAEIGIDSAATSGIVLALNTVAGALGGVAFSFLARRLKRYMMPFSMSMSAVGLCLVFTGNLPFLIAGAVIAGTGTSLNGLAIMFEVRRFLPQEDIGMFTGVNMAAGSIGIFCITGYTGLIALFGVKSSLGQMGVSSVCIAVMLCITLAHVIVTNRKARQIGG